MKLEEKLSDLRALVEQMQKGSADFDKQVELFKRGRALIAECSEYLDTAELEVKILMQGGELAPFDAAE